MTEAVELQLPSDTQHVGLARLVVVTAARRAGMDEERVQDLRIAVSEVTTNAILARQQGGGNGRVRLSFGQTERGMFAVTVEDAGPGFGEDERPGDDASLDDGLATTLIRGLADEVEVERGEAVRMHLRFAVTHPAEVEDGADARSED